MTPSEAISNLPDSIRVGPHDVSFVRMPMNEAWGHDKVGYYSGQSQQIALAAEHATTTQLVDTVFHEALHAMFKVYAIKPSDNEERVVETLATALTDLFRNNPWLAPWITAALGGQG